MARFVDCLALSGALLGAACNMQPPGPGDELLTQFVAGQRLPNQGPLRVTADLPDFGARLFNVEYGTQGTCELAAGSLRAGSCYIQAAFGLEYRGRIGWLRFMPPDSAHVAPFQFQATDDELRGPQFAAALWALDDYGYGVVYTPALIDDPLTPRVTLLRVANELSAWIWPSNAADLLGRADVRSDTTILAVVAGLPLTQGDAYASYRAEARRLLDSLRAH